MYRSTLAAAAVAGLLAFGCDQKTETEKAAEKSADTATNKLEDVKEKAQAGAAEAKETAEKTADAAKAEAEKAADAAQTGAEAVKDEIESLVAKAKDAVKDAKWSDAENYVKQIDSLKAKLPEGARKPIDDMLSEVRTAIENGKKLTMPKM